MLLTLFPSAAIEFSNPHGFPSLHVFGFSCSRKSSPEILTSQVDGDTRKTEKPGEEKFLLKFVIVLGILEVK